MEKESVVVEKLNTPRLLTANEIDCRVAQVSGKGCSLLLYKDARVDMKILDETFGAENWQNGYEVIKNNLYCWIAVRNPVTGEWIKKEDCGVESNTEAEKGEASDSFKRAGFRWGIGRELYNAPFIWLNVPTEEKEANGHKAWVLVNKYQHFEVKSIEITDDRNISSLVIIDSKTHEVMFSFGSGEKVVKAKELVKESDEKVKEQMLTSIHSIYAQFPSDNALKCANYIRDKFNVSIATIDQVTDMEVLTKVWKTMVVLGRNQEAKKGENE